MALNVQFSSSSIYSMLKYISMVGRRNQSQGKQNNTAWVSERVHIVTLEKRLFQQPRKYHQQGKRLLSGLMYPVLICVHLQPYATANIWMQFPFKCKSLSRIWPQTLGLTHLDHGAEVGMRKKKNKTYIKYWQFYPSLWPLVSIKSNTSFFILLHWTVLNLKHDSWQ